MFCSRWMFFVLTLLPRWTWRDRLRLRLARWQVLKMAECAPADERAEEGFKFLVHLANHMTIDDLRQRGDRE